MKPSCEATFNEHYKDRLVPLPRATLNLLREFWQVHRNPVLLFPNRPR